MKKLFILCLFLVGCTASVRVRPEPAPRPAKPNSCTELWCEYVAMDSFCRNPGVTYRSTQRQYACAFVDEYEEVCSD